MPLHLFSLKECHTLVVPLILSLHRSALDNDGDIPPVICHGCEVAKTEVYGQDAGNGPGCVRCDDTIGGRYERLLVNPVVCDYLHLVHAIIRHCTYLNKFIHRSMGE